MVDFNIAPDTSFTPPVYQLDSGAGQQPPLSTNQISFRADKISNALDLEFGPTKDQIMAGAENNIRSSAYDKKASQLNQSYVQDLANAYRSKGTPLSSDELNSFDEAYQRKIAWDSPKTIVESELANKYFGGLYDTAQQFNGWYDDYIKAFPQEEQTITGLGKDFITKQEYLRTKLENAKALAAQQSTAGWIADEAKDIASMGLYSEYQQRGVAGSFWSGLLGSNVETSRLNLMHDPLPIFAQRVDSIVDPLVQKNPSQAVSLLERLLGDSDIQTANFMSGLNLVTLPGMGAAGKVLLKQGLRATEKVVGAAASTEATRVAIPAAAGDLKSAAIAKISGTLVKEAKGEVNPIESATQNFQSILDSQKTPIAANPGNFRELTQRMTDAIDATKDKVVGLVRNNIKLERLPEAFAGKELSRLLEEYVADKYPYLEDNVLNINHHWDPFTNTHFAELVLGQNKGTYWQNADAVGAFAYRQKILLAGTDNMERQLELQRLIKSAGYELDNFRVDADARLGGPAGKADLFNSLKTMSEELATLRSSPGAHIKNDGLGFYLSYFTPVAENSKVMQSVVGKTMESQTPHSLANAAVGFLRTADETFSTNERTMAKLAMYAPNNLLKAMKEEFTEIRSRAKWNIPGTDRNQQWKDLQEAFDAGKSEINPETGAKGYTFSSPGELQDWYLRVKSRMPSEGEVESYFTWKRFVGVFEGFKEMRKYTNDIRRGAEAFQITTTSEGRRIQAPFVDGIKRNAFPVTEEAVLVVGQDGKHVLKTSSQFNNTFRSETARGIKQGSQSVWEVLHPEHFPLSGWNGIGDVRIKYVIHDNIASRPLALKRIADPHRAPYELDHQFYVAQAKMRRDPVTGLDGYYGDVKFAGVDNRAMGDNFAKIINKVGGLIFEKKMAEAEAASKALGKDWEEVRKWFEPGKTPEGRDLPAQFNPGETFRVVPRGMSIAQLDRELENRFTGPKGRSSFRDYSKSIDLHGERDPYDIYSVSDKGTHGNPVFQWEPAKTISPVASMNRAMRKIVNSIYMDDYKAYAVSHWVQEAAPHLDASPYELMTSPEWYFYNGELKKGTPWGTKNLLESNRYKAKQILGTPSKTDTFLHSVSQTMTDNIYTKFGPTKLDPSWMLPRISNVGDFLRAVTYHLAIGLYAVPQLLVQSMTYATIAGVAGFSRAIPGTMGAFMHQLTRFNPSMIDALDKIASKMYIPGTAQFKPGQLKEAWQAMQETGFHIVGSEHSLSTRPYQTNIISNGIHDFADAATIFFKEGERNARFGAWYTAYLEHREKNPTKTLTNYDKTQIFNRADDLAGNMSTASKSMLQEGPMSFATQFLAYNMRLAELFTGHRLNWQQRARLFATYGGLFGVGSLGLSGVPLGDFVRQKAQEHGYVVGDKTVSTWLMEGVPSAMIGMISGNYYNIPQRFGSPGMDQIRDFLEGDKKMWELLAGASGSTLSNAWTYSDGLRQAMMSIFRDKESYFPLNGQDFVDLMKISSTGNNAVRTLEAINTGNWLSRKGQVMSKDISPLNAVMMGLTGTAPQDTADLRDKFISLQDRKDLFKSTEDSAIREYRRGLQAARNKDPEAASQYFTRFRAILIKGNYPVEKYGHLMSEAIHGLESTVRNTNFDFYIRNVPTDQQKSMRDAYSRTQELNKEK